MKFVALVFALTLAAKGQKISGGGRVGGAVSYAPPSASLSLSVGGVTNLQAIISYTAPSGSACTVEVSESATYSPVVYDFNGTLFTGENLDSRASSTNIGTARWVVAGKRNYPGFGTDSKWYSRALQANTLHYVRVNCSGSIGTTTFTTANIPVGSTYNEMPPIDSSTPGGWALPTEDGTRGQIVIDDQTGILMKRMSLQSDKQGGSNGLSIYTGASQRPCNSALHTDPVTGLQIRLCNLDDGNGYHSLYGLLPDGTTRHLGLITTFTSNSSIDDNLQVHFGDPQGNQYTTAVTSSATTLTIGTGSMTFGQGDSAPWIAGMRITAFACVSLCDTAGQEDFTKQCSGTATSYSPSMHQLIVSMDTCTGSGSVTNWGIRGGGNTFRSDYTGNYAAVGGGGAAALSAPTLLNSVPSELLMFNFDSAFDMAHYGCNVTGAAAGQYSPIVCRSGQQDAYGWLGSFYGGDGRPVPTSCMGGDTGCPRVVGAVNTYYDQASKFCGIHETFLLPGTNIVGVNWHGLSTNPGDDTVTTIGVAPIKFTIASTSTGTVIHTTGPPASNSPAETYAAPTVTAGDLIKMVGSSTTYTITAVSGNDWTLNASASVTTGDKGLMACNAPPSLDDGGWSIRYYNIASSMSARTDNQMGGGGHYDCCGRDSSAGPYARVAESSSGYGFVKKGGGTFFASIGDVQTVISSSAGFNGISPPGFGNLLTKHPSIQQETDAQTTAANRFFLDRVAFGGGDPSSSGGNRWYSAATGATNISGQLYQYFSDPAYPLHRKLISTQATTGGSSLRDISGPGSVLGTGSGDSYKYCVAAAANECRSGSSVGNIYFNVPTLTWPYCTGGDPNPSNIDICITDMPVYSGALMQFFMGTSGADSAAKSRNLGYGMTYVKGIFVYPLAKCDALCTWILFTKGIVLSNVGTIDTWLMKPPPLPTPDAVDRSQFIPVPISITAPGGTNNVVVKFGYLENGTNCGSRLEPCYATAATIPSGASPYKYPTDGTAGTLATVTGLSCATSCTVTIPALPSHVLYYQVVYRDASNVIQSSDSMKVSAVL